MARLHTRRHGQSKSKKPTEDKVQNTVEQQKAEELILDYQKQGMRQAMIGQVLKDKHSVGYLKPLLGKRLGAFLKEKGLSKELPEDLLDLMRKAVIMHRHLTTNHQDVHNMTRLHRVESKIWRLTKYYKSTGRLPREWRYDPAQAALIIKEI